MVRGLRKATQEKDLREAFSSRGEITDVRVMKTKTGVSRRFAFVGFRTEEQAQDCCSYFNGTFID
jgi:multiple RNA-binding domain-containing protein 1